MVCECRSPRRSPGFDQLGERAGRGGLELAPVLAELRLDVLEPEQRVHLLLGRAAVGLAGRVVEDPVLGDVQALAHGRVAQRHVVLLGAGQVLQQVPELVGLDDPQVDVDPGVGTQPHACRRRRARVLDEVERGRRARQRQRIGGGGDHVEVLDGVGHPPGRAGQLHLDRGGVLAQRRHQRLAGSERLVEDDPCGPLAGAG